MRLTSLEGREVAGSLMNNYSFEDLQNNTKMWNLKIQNTTNSKSNKIIGIFAKKKGQYIVPNTIVDK